MQRVTQAMLLAAGLSTRMRPMTDKIPKPLLPFLDRTLLDWTLQYLEQAGIQSVAINVHHGKDPFLETIREYRGNLKLTSFVEEEKILGTGGGIKNMRPFIQTKTFVVVNCDFLTDVDLGEAIRFHEKHRAIATAVLIDDARTRKYGALGVDGENRIVEFPYGNAPGGAIHRGFFSGIHIFDRAIFDQMPNDDVFCINKNVYAPLIEKRGDVFGFVSKARWYDLGEIDLYRQSEMKLRKQPLTWMQGGKSHAAKLS